MGTRRLFDDCYHAYRLNLNVSVGPVTKNAFVFFPKGNWYVLTSATLNLNGGVLPRETEIDKAAFPLDVLFGESLRNELRFRTIVQFDEGFIKLRLEIFPQQKYLFLLEGFNCGLANSQRAQEARIIGHDHLIHSKNSGE